MSALHECWLSHWVVGVQTNYCLSNSFKPIKVAEKYFIGNAKELKRLEVTQSSLEKNSKVVLTEKGISPTLVLNETDEKIIPLKPTEETDS